MARMVNLKKVWEVVDALRFSGFEVDAKRAMRAMKEKIKIIAEMTDEEGRIWAIVENGEKGTEYEVRISAVDKIYTCTCKDFKYRKTICKHILSVIFQKLKDENVDKELEEEVKAFYGW